MKVVDQIKKPDENCIKFLRELVEKAESGELIAIAAVGQHFSGHITRGRAGKAGMYPNAFTGGIQNLLFDYQFDHVLEEKEDDE